MSNQDTVFLKDDFQLAHRKDLYIDKVYENQSFWKDVAARLKENKGCIGWSGLYSDYSFYWLYWLRCSQNIRLTVLTSLIKVCRQRYLVLSI